MFASLRNIVHGSHNTRKLRTSRNLAMKGPRKYVGNRLYREKTSGLNSSITLLVAIIGLISTLLGSLLSAYITSRSTIEAARLSVLSELNTSLDLGTADYRERSIYAGNGGSAAVKAYPYGDHLGENSLDNYSTEQFTIEAAVINEYGNKWYRLASDTHIYPKSTSGQAYVFSGDLIYSKDAAIVEWTNNNIQGEQLPVGFHGILGGVIESTNQIIKITAGVFDGEDLLGSLLVIPVDNQYCYSMTNSEINNLRLDQLPVGNDYRLDILVDYLSNAGQLVCSKEITSSFEVTDESPPFETLFNKSIVYQGNGEPHEVKRYPYDDKIEENTLEEYTSKQFSIVAVVRNAYGEIWYQLDPLRHSYEYNPAFIFSGDVLSIESSQGDN